jgi:hypothetical protein
VLLNHPTFLNIVDVFVPVNYDEPSQVPNWGHPPDPNVQSKSFKMLQRHLQQHEDGKYQLIIFSCYFSY